MRKKEKPEAKKKRTEEDGLDILTEVKEPFSLSGFFDTHVAGKFRYAKNMLKEKGILFFLFSPFQARSRLIAQMVILAAGILFGIVPRATSLMTAMQNMAYQSELTGVAEKQVGDLTVTPAASSHYERQHMLAFVLTGKNLPSDVSRYDIRLAKSYGASDWADVAYSYNLYPVDNDRRILLVCLDQTNQASGYGAFSLFVGLKDADLETYELENCSFEIVISTAQETSDLYNSTGIHLSALTEDICGTGNIGKAQEDLKDALAEYQIALEQAEAMPMGITVTPTTEDLETYCLKNRLYRDLTDTSTTEDIAGISKETAEDLSYPVVLTAGGIPYDEAWVTEHTKTDGVVMSEDEGKIAEEFTHVNEAKDKVLSAMEAVNTEASNWYQTLNAYQLVLNQTPDLASFPVKAQCAGTLFSETAELSES